MWKGTMDLTDESIIEVTFLYESGQVEYYTVTGADFAGFLLDAHRGSAKLYETETERVLINRHNVVRMSIKRIQN